MYIGPTLQLKMNEICATEVEIDPYSTCFISYLNVKEVQGD
jgi:hypothetical protein